MRFAVLWLALPLFASPAPGSPADNKKVEYPWVVNLRTVNDFGHQEVYYTYYPKDDQEKKAKLKECEDFARKVIGGVDSHYQVIIGSNCTVDR
jgi:hypothetical protein